MPAGISPDQVERIRLDGQDNLLLRVAGGRAADAVQLVLRSRATRSSGWCSTTARCGRRRRRARCATSARRGGDFLQGTRWDETLRGARGQRPVRRRRRQRRVRAGRSAGSTGCSTSRAMTRCACRRASRPTRWSASGLDGQRQPDPAGSGHGGAADAVQLVHRSRATRSSGWCSTTARCGRRRRRARCATSARRGGDFLQGTRMGRAHRGARGQRQVRRRGGNDVYVLGDLRFDAVFDFAGDDEVRMPAGISPDQVERIRTRRPATTCCCG